MAQGQWQFLDYRSLGIGAVGGIHQHLVNVPRDPDTVKSLGAGFLEPADASGWDRHIFHITSLPADDQFPLLQTLTQSEEVNQGLPDEGEVLHPLHNLHKIL